MYIVERTVDDLLRRVLPRLIRGRPIVNKRGDCREVVGAMLRLRDPRARLSRTVQKGTLFSCLGELLWYLSGSDRLDFVAHYLSRYEEDSEDGQTIFGAYGPRLFGGGGRTNQFESVRCLLGSSRATTRRAVIALFEPADIVGEQRVEIPCTTTLQFLVRNRKLQLVASMRSNDAYFGLPHDIFAFTMIQEIMARCLRLELGTYTHLVGSLHLYERRVPDAEQYLSEGWQQTVSMPPMPLGDPWPSIRTLLEFEAHLRTGTPRRPSLRRLPSYWADFARILEVFAVQRQVRQDGKSTRARRRLAALRRAMESPVYDTYIERRERVLLSTRPQPPDAQVPLFSPPTAPHDGGGE